MNESNRILNYWHSLEFFSPFWPNTNKDTKYIDGRNKSLDWIENHDPKYTYNVYLGRARSQELIDKMLEALEQEDDRMEKDNSQSCIFAFKLTHDGMYVEDSFSLSTFVWSFAKIIYEKDLNAELSVEEIDEFNKNINDILIRMNKKIEYEDLEKIYEILIEKLKFHPDFMPFTGIVNKSFSRKANIEDDSEETDIEGNTDMFPSFYASDINMIRKNIQSGDEISHYIKALIKDLENPIEIDRDISEMKKCLSPEKYPLGKWPSIYSPSLMQQLAINIGISDSKDLRQVFSVNGPPGTGKTTLLKEIIASNIVERAILLSEYDDIDKEAFERYEYDSPENKFLRYYYKPDPRLKKFGILVASNNNAAVENISKELPIGKDVKESNTSLFNVDENEEIYFSDIANALTDDDEKNWGLISARLGRKSNLNELKQALWFNEENENLLDFYNGEIPSWEKARKDFKEKYKEVLSYRDSIKVAVKNQDEHKEVKEEYNLSEKKVSSEKNKIEEHKNLIGENLKKKKDIESQIDTSEESREILNKRLSFIKKLLPFFFKKDPIMIEFKDTKDQLDKLAMSLIDIKRTLDKNNLELENLKENHRLAVEEFKLKKDIYLKSCEKIKKYKEQFGSNYADEDFWKDIENNEVSQLASPWTDKKYDRLREELFYYGLMVQKAFVLNSRSVKQNINCLVNMWNGGLTEDHKAKSYAHLLNTLFLLVPVLSTTFASVATFLKHVGKDELGTLVIDEAGQATPHSALGALWRSSKAIVVGDPLQVEPVVTVPKELSEKLAEELNIDSEYRDQNLSVQILADRMNPYGGYREYLDGEIWLGCPLVVHRRCLDPMFLISNKIAYNNRMFKQSNKADESTLLFLEESTWLNIKGKEKGDKDHFVAEQGEKVVEMVVKSFELQNDFPNIYIISPFKTVAESIKRLLKNRIALDYPSYRPEDINSWVDKSCGTVHTFQGKEANEVILVLGCDEESGQGAAQWAGKKPNILNVAVTRAKYRLAIIGDSNLWKKVPNFDFACKELLEEKRDK